MQRRTVRPVSSYQINFDGTNDTITFGNNLGFERTDSRTIAYWVKGSLTGHPISKQNAAGQIGFSLYHSAGAVQFYLQGTPTGANSIGVSTASIYLQNDAWIPILITYNGTAIAEGVEFYIWSNNAVNNKTILSNNLSASIITSDSLTLGARPGAAGFIKGSVKNVAIWNRLLTSAERDSFFNAGVDGYLGSIASSSLLAYYNPKQADNLSATLPAITGGFPGTCNNMTINNKGSVYSGDSRGLVWNPRYVPNLRFYSDMDTGVVTSSGGTIVESVADQMGVISSFGFIKNSTTGPTFLPNWRNGHAAFTSSVSTNYLKSSVVATGLTQPCFTIIVGQWRGTTSILAAPITTDTGATAFAPVVAAVTGEIQTYAGTNQTLLAGQPSTLLNAPFIALSIMDGANTRVYLRIHNGDDMLLNVSGTPGTQTGNSTVGWGAKLVSNTQLWEAPLAAVGQGSGIPTYNTINYILNTLSVKYNIVASSQFNPLNIPLPAQVFDTEHISSSGGNVTQYTDQSGNVRNAANAGGNVPITSSWRNSKAAVTPSASTYLLDSTSYTMAQPYTTFFVGQFPPDASATRTILQGSTASFTSAPLYSSNAGTIGTFAGNSVVFGPTPADLFSQPFAAMIIHDGANSRIRIKYQDGYEYLAFVPSTVGTQGISTAYWGRNNSGSELWPFQIAARSLYTGALTPQQQDYILNGYCSYYGIVPEETPDYMSWNCNGGSLPLVNDGYLGTGANLTTAGASVTFGSDGFVFNGSGSTNWVRTATAGTPFEWNYNTYSASMWIYPTATTVGSYGAILSKSANPTSWVGLFSSVTPFLVGTTRILYAEIKNTAGTAFTLNSGVILPLNAWSHIGSTYDGFTMKIYFNGQLAASIGVPFSTPIGWSNHGPWFIGSNNAVNSAQSEYLPGKYQKIKISPVVRSASWFETEYLAGHF